MTADANATPQPGTELVIGLVGAIGTDLDAVEDILREHLAAVGFATRTVRVIEQLLQLEKYEGLPTQPEYERYRSRIDAGDEFCEQLERGEALAWLAAADIRASREPERPQAWIVRSLKRPEEVELLRLIYRDVFFLISAYSPRADRVDKLARRFAESEQTLDSEPHRASAEELVNRDEREDGARFGQNVGSTFPMADAFVDATNRKRLEPAVRRVVEVLFGHPFRTPTRDEYGMVHAYTSSLRSSDLSRQVGVSIMAGDGSVLALGTNEVPSAGGGLYWEGDENDARDFQLKKNHSYRLRRDLLADALRKLRDMGWLTEATADAVDQNVTRLIDDAMATGQLRDIRVMDVIEFGRTVHAEMAAISTAAKQGTRIGGATIYSTTFPCHECARHIVAAGIQRVVYIDPYPKSLVRELFADSIAVNQRDSREPTEDHRVVFETYVGLSPRSYSRFFTKHDRRGPGPADVAEWIPNAA